MLPYFVGGLAPGVAGRRRLAYFLSHAGDHRLPESGG